MANPNFSDVSPGNKPDHAISKPKTRAASAPMPERTAGWGGLPGKSQPKDRSGGVMRLKTHPKSEGL